MKQQQLDWRRAQVPELSSMGYSQGEIARTLQVDLAAVNRDIHFLRQQAQENLQRHIHETVPEEYQNCITGMKRNLKQTLEIAETTTDPKTKLQARAVANDCYKYIMDLATNGVVVTNALEYIQGKTDHLNESEKKLSREGKGEASKESEEPDYGEEEELEEGQEKNTGELEEEKTNNSIF
jgi:predicted transcriptional regulator